MKRVLKGLGIGLGGLVVVAGVAVIVLHFVGRARLERAPQTATRPVAVPTDAAALARGEHLVDAVLLCRECHGKRLEGTVFIDGEMGAYVAAPDLTSAGVGAAYSDADWERAVRHGVGGDGRTLVIMPSQIYAHLSDDDLGAVIAFLKSAPAVDSAVGPRRIGFPGTLMGGVLGFSEFTHVNDIDHAAVGASAPPEGATAAYGEYLMNIAPCRECHGANLAGNNVPDGPPMGPNLTPGGELQGWNEADFISVLRTGVTPSGHELDGEEMPWSNFGQMTDVELQAIWAYLHSLPALPTNEIPGS